MKIIVRLACTGAYIPNRRMEETTKTIGQLILFMFTVLPTHVCTYKILLVPLSAQSHVFSMSAIALGLANRGHKVTMYIGENFMLNIPELRNRTEISVIRYKDAIDGVNVDYTTLEDMMVQAAFETGGHIQHITSLMNKM